MGEGEVSTALSHNLEKSVLILEKSALIVTNNGLNFSFRMQVFLGGKTRNFSLWGLSF